MNAASFNTNRGGSCLFAIINGFGSAFVIARLLHSGANPQRKRKTELDIQSDDLQSRHNQQRGENSHAKPMPTMRNVMSCSTIITTDLSEIDDGR